MIAKARSDPGASDRRQSASGVIVNAPSSRSAKDPNGGERAQHPVERVGIGIQAFSELPGRPGSLGGDDVGNAQAGRDVHRLGHPSARDQAHHRCDGRLRHP